MTDSTDKMGEDEHHIHGGNEYVVGQKTITRSNGCGLNKITITTNPLTDADNKVRYVHDFLYISLCIFKILCHLFVGAVLNSKR